MSDLENEIKLLREKADLLEKLKALEPTTKTVEKSPEVETKEQATARAHRCANKINVCLMEDRCFFNPIVIFSGQGGFTSTVKIMPMMDEKVDDPMMVKIINDGHDPRNDS
jgi:hypothetical protein